MGVPHPDGVLAQLEGVLGPIIIAGPALCNSGNCKGGLRVVGDEAFEDCLVNPMFGNTLIRAGSNDSAQHRSRCGIPPLDGRAAGAAEQQGLRGSGATGLQGGSCRAATAVGVGAAGAGCRCFFLPQEIKSALTRSTLSRIARNFFIDISPCSSKCRRST